MDLLNNPFCNDLSHNLSFGHLNTHPIIYPNIEKLKMKNILDTKTKVETYCEITWSFRITVTFEAFHTRII